MKERTLLRETPLQDLSQIQKKVIYKLSNVGCSHFESFCKVNERITIEGLFCWDQTKEPMEYWDEVTVLQFEKDILEEKFNYLLGINVNNLSTNLNKIITKLNNYVNIKTN